MKNLVSQIFYNAHSKNLSNKIALKTKNEEFTYNQLFKIIICTRNFLILNDIKKKDIVINSLGNSVEHLVVHYATILLGL